jgi:ubiquinone/menaquinone biosynthesis C-methylase UbiE
MRATTLNLLQRSGIQPGMACLDIGCGGGDVSFDLARLVGPNGRVAGIDIDEVKMTSPAVRPPQSSSATSNFDWSTLAKATRKRSSTSLT